MDQLRAGIVGCGTIARRHAEQLVELGEDVSAVADINPDARRTFAADFGATDAYEDYERMIEDADLDFVVVAVPNALHADCAVAALDADIDVFVEKPIAHTLEDARRIEAAERDSEGTVMVGFVKAFEPWFEDVRRRVRRGDLGAIYDVDASYVRRRGIPQLGSWFTRKDVAGGGVLIDAGVHVLHLALSALDFPDVETVSGSTEAHFGTKSDYTYLRMWGGGPVEDATFDTEDYARGIVRTGDGTTIHLHSTWANNSDSHQHLRLHGDEGGTETTLGGSRPETTVYGTDGDALTDTNLQFPEGDSFRAEWEYFASVVRGEREHTRNTLAEGVAVQEVIEALYESAERNREVVLEDL